MTGILYCTMERVKSALDSVEVARSNLKVIAAIAAGARAIEGPPLLNRRFYPETTTRTFDYPDWNRTSSLGWRLWLGTNELISATQVTSGGVVIPSTDYFLRNGVDDTTPPFDRIEIDLASSAMFSVGETHQRSISIAGTYSGCAEVYSTAGALAEALDDSETGVDVTNSSVIGVGSIIKVDSERMIVIARNLLDSGQNTGGALAENKGVRTVPVSDGTLFFVDEVITVDAESMLITDIAGNNLIVVRQWDGSSLAAHLTNADVYVRRSLTVERGALGTTSATHSTSTAVSLYQVPDLVSDLNEAEALTRLLDKGAGYARTAGSGEGARELRGTALTDLRKQAIAAHGRLDPYRGAI